MPELPEVETMVRGLRPALAGRRLVRLKCLDARLLENCVATELEQLARGASVHSVERRGKWVVIDLESAKGSIVIQPRMTGGFWLVEPVRPDHVRLVFEVEGRREPIWFCDTRRLGRLAWYPTPARREEAIARSQGPDALTIDPKTLGDRLRRTNRAIKPALMDQKLLAGIGNIYADEILFTARIHPRRVARHLRAAEIARLHGSIATVLHAAIAAEGSSFDLGYRTVLGLEGGFLAQNSVYGRAGEACRLCRAAIERIRFPGLIGRSTYVCPRCQRAPRAVGSGRAGRSVRVRLD